LAKRFQNKIKFERIRPGADAMILKIFWPQKIGDETYVPHIFHMFQDTVVGF
jgi:hypothetical protein